MYILIGAKGNSLGAKIHQRLKKTHVNEDFLAVDIDDFDATNYDAMEKFFDENFDDPVVDGVVSFVGVMRNARIIDESPDKVMEVFRVNALSLFNASKCFYPYFAKEGHGRLVHLGSNAAAQGFSGMIAYCASKFATRGMIQVIAKEYAKIGAVANQINPGPFEPGSSSMSNLQVEEFMVAQNLPQEKVIANMVSRIPEQRLATVADLYSVIEYLLFDASEYITGQSLNLSGGMVM